MLYHHAKIYSQYPSFGTLMRLPDSINLYVQGCLGAIDAQRQQRTATTILARFAERPGIILGDEVGMGKTFVALAVAAAYIIDKPKCPVIAMVPKQVVKKWKIDAATFTTRCMGENEQSMFCVKIADSALELLRLLDGPDPKPSFIILAHGTLSRQLNDRWVSLAILQAAIKGRHGAADLRSRVARFGYGILPGKVDEPQCYLERLNSAPSDWPQPIPATILHALESGTIDLTGLRRAIDTYLPTNISADLDGRLARAKTHINDAKTGIPAIWKQCLRSMRHKLPLLILDEAHRTRNGNTQLASLFDEESLRDVETVAGALNGTFDRMLFLTATPFQLGHRELCNVLSRFDAIRWEGRNSPTMTKAEFTNVRRTLQSTLDQMQRATEQLEANWKQTVQTDHDEALAAYGAAWWSRLSKQPDDPAVDVKNTRIRQVMRAYGVAASAIKLAEGELKPWVLRHGRALTLPNSSLPRRERIEGNQVLCGLPGQDGVKQRAGGLSVSGKNCLPFLLAARMSSLPGYQRGFGESFASSFDAFIDSSTDSVEHDDTASQKKQLELKELAWYKDQITAAIPTRRASRAHPKLHATVELAMDLWRKGEKVLIFCYYRATGAALHRHLSEAVRLDIEQRVALKLRCPASEVQQRLKTIADHWSKNRNARRDSIELINKVLLKYKELQFGNIAELIQEVVLRFLRTPTFLLRFAPLNDKQRLPANWVQQCFSKPDAAGITFDDLLVEFLNFLAQRPDTIRKDYLDALLKVQTGTHAGPEVNDSFTQDERPDDKRTKLVATVRRVYGETKDDTRNRLMLTFNTPFYPEILISSSVMAEGVDLHLNCRHIIHHDLEWNPSSLEQRTGRIDRLGAKAERCGKPIMVYIPYIDGCQDEKLFRVVSDRERWFNVVMGAEQAIKRILDASSTEIDKLAEHPSVPIELVQALTMRLGTKGEN
jgi:hypothetical protein